MRKLDCVLDVPVERIAAEVKAPGGVTGTGAVFAINHNGDNALATLRYRLKDADFQSAEESFEAGGQKFNRGSFIVRNVAAATLDAAARELGVKVLALAAAPTVKMHPARAARVAILHAWTSTQTEGWWRLAFGGCGCNHEHRREFGWASGTCAHALHR